MKKNSNSRQGEQIASLAAGVEAVAEKVRRALDRSETLGSASQTVLDLMQVQTGYVRAEHGEAFADAWQQGMRYAAERLRDYADQWAGVAV